MIYQEKYTERDVLTFNIKESHEYWWVINKFKGALDKYNIIPNFFKKKMGFLYY